MVELKGKDESTMSQSFAGDVYNSAVYLKRCFPGIETSVVTAIGEDKLSDKMLRRFADEKLNTQFVFRHPTKSPGMYLIETDNTGERSFTYWRSDSAARKVVNFLTSEVTGTLASGEMFFFSGISLAVIEPSARELFWHTLEMLKRSGVKIVFDPNYRPRLWTSPEEAQNQFNKALSLSDIAMPGVEDFTALYGVETAQGVVDFCQRYELEELVVKNGPESVVTAQNGQLTNHEIIPVERVVDTTSAGDAFNGVYLGARVSGKDIPDAVRMAARAAGTVIQHPGAIIPANVFRQAMLEVD